MPRGRVAQRARPGVENGVGDGEIVRRILVEIELCVQAGHHFGRRRQTIIWRAGIFAAHQRRLPADRRQQAADRSGEERCRHAVTADVQQVKPDVLLVEAEDIEHVAGQLLARLVQPFDIDSVRFRRLFRQKRLLKGGRGVEILAQAVIGASQFLIQRFQLLIVRIQLLLQRDDALADLNPGTEFAPVERLDDEIVGAGVEAVQHIGFFGSAGQEDGVDVVRVGLRAQAADDLDAFHFRHVPVENGQLRRVVYLEFLQCLEAIIDGDHFVSQFLHGVLHETQGTGIVVGYENFHFI